jgi:CRP-like cAMP-binding protein
MNKNLEEPVCKNCNLEFKSIFKKLTLPQLELLNTNKTCHLYKKGAVLYDEGNRVSGIYCIYDGVLKLYKTGSEGKEQIIRFAKTGDIVGYRSVINGEQACTSVKILEDATLCFINTNTLYTLLRENADFAIELLQIACKELGIANNYITDIAQKSVRERLAEILLELKMEFGVNNDEMINISLTREELANIVGTATESVIRILSDFKSERILELHGRRIKIIDESKLRKNINAY